jgi:anti-sigma regulatory factor (Ser/Thr protein kinase)
VTVEPVVQWVRRAVERGPGPYSFWPSRLEAVGEARDHVVVLARAAGATEEMQTDIRLAVSEACANAVVHAVTARSERGETLTLSTAVRDGQFHVWIGDEGENISRPLAQSGGMGAGLMLMSHLCQGFEIGVLEDGRTQVELCFDLP